MPTNAQAKGLKGVTVLELHNIQAGVLRPRPTPYAGAYIGVRIDDPTAGRDLLKRLIPLVASAGDRPNTQRPQAVIGQRHSNRQDAHALPTDLGRNGSYVAYRKLYQDVAAFRRFLAHNAASVTEQELLAAKMMGRWRSGAPLALCPAEDDPELGADTKRNDNFLYHDDDREGFKTPLGSHVRRMNPRDHFKDELLQVKRHRMIRRGTVYGPALPEGVLEDDGADRGILFLFIGADLNRQFEFVQREWINQGIFIGSPAEKDPITGPNDGTGAFTIPTRPIRQRCKGLSQFVISRGGEYFFLPGLPALRWLADGTYGVAAADGQRASGASDERSHSPTDERA